MNCKQCGRPIEAPKCAPHKEFCSVACRRLWWKQAEEEVRQRIWAERDGAQIQALDRTQPGLPLKRGRCGTMRTLEVRDSAEHMEDQPAGAKEDGKS